jgi:hypothetical protein
MWGMLARGIFLSTGCHPYACKGLDKCLQNRQNRASHGGDHRAEDITKAMTRTGRNVHSCSREPCCCETALNPFRDDLRAVPRTRDPLASRRRRLPPLSGRTGPGAPLPHPSLQGGCREAAANQGWYHEFGHAPRPSDGIGHESV